MALNTFNIGDLVQLKSGGPTMTVYGEEELTGDAICKWFDNKQEKFGSFAEATLKAHVEPKTTVGVASVRLI